MTDAVLYEHHRRLDRQARRRVIGQTVVSGIALALGLWLIPEGGFVNFSAAKGVTGILSFAFGHLLLISGLAGLFLEFPRWLLNRGRDGAWHIRLKDDSGMSLETLALRLEKAGVAFERTFV